MKNLKDYSNDVYKCTKCGLCQAVCPIFEHTGLECAVSRGKFNILNGVINGELKMTHNVVKYMDLCLNCNACTKFCPSEINAEEILTVAKNDAKCSLPFFNRKILSLIKVFLTMLRFFQIDKILNVSYPLLLRMGIIGKTLIWLNKILHTNVQRTHIKSQAKSKLKVLYFSGCINEYINPSVKNATLNILETQGIEVIQPNFDCCGIPHRASGDLKRFKAYAIKNIKQINGDFDYMITDCASCKAAWLMYAEILDGEEAKKAQEIAAKTVHINDFLPQIDLKQIKAQAPTSVTYHYPCHLTNFGEKNADPTDIIKQIPNVEYIEMNDATKCCGAGGAFFIKHFIISGKISAQKANNIIKTDAQTVITSCPSCIIGINKGLLALNKNICVKHISEFISDLMTKS